MDNEKLLQSISDMMDKKLQPINDRLDKIESRLDKIESRLDKTESRLDKIESRLDKTESRFDKIESRLDMIEIVQKRTIKKLDDLQLDVKIAERDIRRDIHDLNDEMETVIEVLKMNDMLTR